MQKLSATPVATNEFGFSDTEVSILKSEIIPKATGGELNAFMAQCSKWDLSPFTQQVYSIRRFVYNSDTRQSEPRQVTHVSIGGLRIIAERTTEYAGQTIPLFCGKDGVWKEVWSEASEPFACKIGVHRKGFVEPLFRVCRWQEFVQTNKDSKVIGQWVNMHTVMLTKVTEATVLRAAFPAVLAGAYIAEEIEAGMHNADNDTDTAAQTSGEEETPVRGVNSVAAKLEAAVSTPQYATIAETPPVAEATNDEVLKVRKDFVMASLSEYGIKTRKWVTEILGEYKAASEWVEADIAKIEQWLERPSTLVLFQKFGGTIEVLNTLTGNQFPELTELTKLFDALGEDDRKKVDAFVEQKKAELAASKSVAAELGTASKKATANAE